MSRRDAQKLIDFQMLQPWDATTAPHKVPLDIQGMRKRLIEWEREKGLNVDMRAVMANARKEAAAGHRRRREGRKNKPKPDYDDDADELCNPTQE